MKIFKLIVLSIIFISSNAISASDCGIRQNLNHLREFNNQRNQLIQERNNYTRMSGGVTGAIDLVHGQGTSTFAYDSRINQLSNDINMLQENIKMALELKKLGACK